MRQKETNVALMIVETISLKSSLCKEIQEYQSEKITVMFDFQTDCLYIHIQQCAIICHMPIHMPCI